MLYIKINVESILLLLSIIIIIVLYCRYSFSKLLCTSDHVIKRKKVQHHINRDVIVDMSPCCPSNDVMNTVDDGRHDVM